VPAISLRLAGYYAAYFATVGILLPYWPVWLQAHGLGAGEIGALLGVVLWLKVLVSPLIAQAADARRARRRFMVGLSALALAGYAGIALSDALWGLLVLALLGGVALAAILPLGDATVLAQVYARGLDYGRLRLWGSIAFILTSVGLGHLVGFAGVDLVLWALLASLCLLTLSAAALPAEVAGGGAGTEVDAPAGGAIRYLLRRPVFLIFVLTISLNQASHAALYGFATLHWRAAGIDDGTIGLLWAEGVVAEIALFSLSNRVLRRFGIANLMLIAALAGVVRWFAMGASAALPVLIAVQALHGLTFGAGHLAAMHFIARAIPPQMTATAQSLNSALAGGIATGLSLLLAGWLYDLIAGRAFLAMVLLAAAAVASALWLRRRWAGDRI